MNIIISGPLGFGKTTCAQKVVTGLKKKGILYGGVLNPDESIVDLSTGKEKTFTQSSVGEDTTAIGRYHILPEALEHAKKIILDSVAKKQWTFIDECGKLELQRGGGYYDVLKEVLPKGKCIICIRDMNVEDFFTVFGQEEKNTKVYILNKDNRGVLHEKIIKEISKITT